MDLPAVRTLIVIEQVDDILRIRIADDRSLVRGNHWKRFRAGAVLIDAVRRGQDLRQGQKGCKPNAGSRPGPTGFLLRKERRKSKHGAYDAECMRGYAILAKGSFSKDLKAYEPDGCADDGSGEQKHGLGSQFTDFSVL